MLVVDVPASFCVRPVRRDVVEVISLGGRHTDARTARSQRMGTACLIAMVVREDCPVDRRNIQFLQHVGHTAVTTVDQQRLLAVADDADVDRPMVDEDVLADLAQGVRLRLALRMLRWAPFDSVFGPQRPAKRTAGQTGRAESQVAKEITSGGIGMAHGCAILQELLLKSHVQSAFAAATLSCQNAFAR